MQCLVHGEDLLWEDHFARTVDWGAQLRLQKWVVKAGCHLKFRVSACVLIRFKTFRGQCASLHSSTDRRLQSHQIKFSFSVSFSHLIHVPGIVLIGSKGTEVRNEKFFMGFDEGQLRHTCLRIDLKIKPVFIIWSEKSGPLFCFSVFQHRFTKNMVDEHSVLPPNPDFTGTRLNLYLCYIDITRPKGKASWAYFLKAQAPFRAFPLRSFLFTRSLRVSVFVQHSWIVFTSTTLPRSTHSSLSYLSLKEHTHTKKIIKINSYCPKYSWMCALPPECGWFSRLYTQRKMAVPSPTANNCPLPHGCVGGGGYCMPFSLLHCGLGLHGVLHALMTAAGSYV